MLQVHYKSLLTNIFHRFPHLRCQRFVIKPINLKGLFFFKLQTSC